MRIVLLFTCLFLSICCSLSQSNFPVITSIFGCTDIPSLNMTIDCSFKDSLTITGSNFGSINTLTIESINQPLANARINCVRRICTIILPEIVGWYYTYHDRVGLPVIVSSQVAASDPFYGVAFPPIQPYIKQVIGCLGASQYSAYGCTANSQLTVLGQNLWPMPDVVVGPAWSDSYTYPLFQCKVLWMATNGSMMFVQFPEVIPDGVPINQFLDFRLLFGAYQTSGPYRAVPSPSSRVVAVTVEYPANISSSSSSSSSSTGRSSSSSRRPRSSSSSSGSLPPENAPIIYRISGCVDSSSLDVLGTDACPTLKQSMSVVELTIYGWNFASAPQSSYRLSINGVPMTLVGTLRDSDEQLRFEVLMVDAAYISLPTNTWMTLDLTYTLQGKNGTSSMTDAIRILPPDTLPVPSIIRVTGCVNRGITTTDCRPGQAITLHGENFPIYALSQIIVGTIDRDASRCWVTIRDVGALVCSLPNPPFIATGWTFGITLKFPQFMPEPLETTIDSVVSYASTVSSTGSKPIPTSSDELDGMKYALMVIMLVALIVLVTATFVYLFTCWKAQRRAFVSSHGSAAIDMREVLLN